MGGIIVGWNSAVLGQIMNVGEFSLTVKFYSKQFKFQWHYTLVYGPIERSHKYDFWKELRTNGGSPIVPAITYGDFNAILIMEDKVTGVPNLEDIQCANSFMHYHELWEPPRGIGILLRQMVKLIRFGLN